MCLGYRHLVLVWMGSHVSVSGDGDLQIRAAISGPVAHRLVLAVRHLAKDILQANDAGGLSTMAEMYRLLYNNGEVRIQSCK